MHAASQATKTITCVAANETKIFDVKRGERISFAVGRSFMFFECILSPCKKKVHLEKLIKTKHLGEVDDLQVSRLSTGNAPTTRCCGRHQKHKITTPSRLLRLFASSNFANERHFAFHRGGKKPHLRHTFQISTGLDWVTMF